MPNNFRFYVESTQVRPVFTCCREMQVDTDIIDSNDDNFVNIFSFNNKIKDYEATESLVFFELVQNALAQLRKTA